MKCNEDAVAASTSFADSSVLVGFDEDLRRWPSIPASATVGSELDPQIGLEGSAHQDPNLPQLSGLQHSSHLRDDLGSAGMDYWIEMTGRDGFVDIGTDLSPCGETGFDQVFDWGAINTATPLSVDEGGPSSFTFDSIGLSTNSKTGSTVHDASITRKKNPLEAQEKVACSEDDSVLPDDEPTEQLASRLGRLRIAEDGHLRYYGATSNLHMLRSSQFSCFQPTIRTILGHGEAALRRSGLYWDSDPEYEDHLTALFFAWHNTFLGIVNEEVYYSQRELYRSGATATAYYSPTLENAM
jgi:hypothetical protein